MRMERRGWILATVLVAVTLRPARAGAASCGNAVYMGGPMISNVEVVEVYWTAGVVQAVKDYLPPFFTAVTASSYLDWLYEYDLPAQFIGRGHFKGAHTITPATTATSLTDAQVSAELTAQIAAGTLPAPSFDGAGNVNTIYTIDFPPGYAIQIASGNASCMQFCSYYSSVAMNGRQVPYAVFPDLSSGACATGCGTGNLTANAGAEHSVELLNSITGPDVTATGGTPGWFSNSCGGIGYMCSGVTMTVAGYPVAEGWSNRLATCVVGASSIPPPCVGQPPGSSACRGCTVSDDGIGCSGATPHCDTDPTDVTFGQCIAARTVDAGSDGSSDGSRADRPGSTGGACVPGQQVACACVGGGAGAQICLASGAGYGACQCPDGSTNGDGGNVPSPKSSGCGCQTGPGHSAASLVLGVALMIGLASRRRRLPRPRGRHRPLVKN